MSYLNKKQEFIPPVHNYVPQHPDWQPSEGFFSKTKVAKMTRKQLEKELNKANIKFDASASDDDLRKQVQAHRDAQPSTMKKMRMFMKKAGKKMGTALKVAGAIASKIPHEQEHVCENENGPCRLCEKEN